MAGYESEQAIVNASTQKAVDKGVTGGIPKQETPTVIYNCNLRSASNINSKQGEVKANDRFTRLDNKTYRCGYYDYIKVSMESGAFTGKSGYIAKIYTTENKLTATQIVYADADLSSKNTGTHIHNMDQLGNASDRIKNSFKSTSKDVTKYQYLSNKNLGQNAYNITIMSESGGKIGTCVNGNDSCGLSFGPFQLTEIGLAKEKGKASIQFFDEYEKNTGDTSLRQAFINLYNLRLTKSATLNGSNQKSYFHLNPSLYLSSADTTSQGVAAAQAIINREEAVIAQFKKAYTAHETVMRNAFEAAWVDNFYAGAVKDFLAYGINTNQIDSRITIILTRFSNGGPVPFTAVMRMLANTMPLDGDHTKINTKHKDFTAETVVKAIQQYHAESSPNLRTGHINAYAQMLMGLTQSGAPTNGAEKGSATSIINNNNANRVQDAPKKQDTPNDASNEDLATKFGDIPKEGGSGWSAAKDYLYNVKKFPYKDKEYPWERGSKGVGLCSYATQFLMSKVGYTMVWEDAKNMAPHMSSFGYGEIAQVDTNTKKIKGTDKTYTPQEGDVGLILPDDGPACENSKPNSSDWQHMMIYLGNDWVSDFIQQYGLCVYKHGNETARIYRKGGAKIVSQDNETSSKVEKQNSTIPKTTETFPKLVETTTDVKIRTAPNTTNASDTNTILAAGQTIKALASHEAEGKKWYSFDLSGQKRYVCSWNSKAYFKDSDQQLPDAKTQQHPDAKPQLPATETKPKGFFDSISDGIDMISNGLSSVVQKGRGILGGLYDYVFGSNESATTDAQNKNSITDKNKNSIINKIDGKKSSESLAVETEPAFSSALSTIAEAKAIRWYEYKKIPSSIISEIQGIVQTKVTGKADAKTVQAVAKWQKKVIGKNNPYYVPDGEFGPGSARSAGKQELATRIEEACKGNQAPANVDNDAAAYMQKGDPDKVDQSGGSKYFTIAELTHSNTAVSNGIDNRVPNEEIKNNLLTLMKECLDPIRDALGHSLYVNSGYRSIKTNAAVGGVGVSQHMSGEAADLNVTKDSDKQEILKICEEKGIKFDQFLLERSSSGSSWLHISYSKKKARHDVKGIYVNK